MHLLVDNVHNRTEGLHFLVHAAPSHCTGKIDATAHVARLLQTTDEYFCYPRCKVDRGWHAIQDCTHWLVGLVPLCPRR